VSHSTQEDMSRSTTDSRRAHPTVWGGWRGARARRSSPMCLRTISALSGTIWLAATGSTRNGWYPYCMFTDPPLARVGLSEAEARHQGVAVRNREAADRRPCCGRGQRRETCGFMKALVAADGDRILGFAMIGAEAGEVMAVVQTAMLAGHAVHGLARRDPRAPDNGRGPGRALLERAGPIRLAQNPWYPD